MASKLRYFYFLKAFLSVLFLKSHMVLASDIKIPFKDLTFAPLTPLKRLRIASESNTFLKNQSKDKKTPADKERNKENEKEPTDTINTIIKDIFAPSFYITDLREQKNKINNPKINIKNISFAQENLGGFVKPSPQASSSASSISCSSSSSASSATSTSFSSKRSLPLSASSPSHAKARQALREELRNYSRQAFTYEERQEFKRRFGISYLDALGQRPNFVYNHPHYPHKKTLVYRQYRESGGRKVFELGAHDLKRFLMISEDSSFELRFVSSLAEIESHLQTQDSNSIDWLEIGGHGNSQGISLNETPGLNLSTVSVFDEALWQDKLCQQAFIYLDSCMTGLEDHEDPSSMCFARYLSRSVKGHPVIGVPRSFTVREARISARDPHLQRVTVAPSSSSSLQESFCDLAYFCPEDSVSLDQDALSEMKTSIHKKILNHKPFKEGFLKIFEKKNILIEYKNVQNTIKNEVISTKDDQSLFLKGLLSEISNILEQKMEQQVHTKTALGSTAITDPSSCPSKEDVASKEIIHSDFNYNIKFWDNSKS